MYFFGLNFLVSLLFTLYLVEFFYIVAFVKLLTNIFSYLYIFNYKGNISFHYFFTIALIIYLMFNKSFTCFTIKINHNNVIIVFYFYIENAIKFLKL